MYFVLSLKLFVSYVNVLPTCIPEFSKIYEPPSIPSLKTLRIRCCLQMMLCLWVQMRGVHSCVPGGYRMARGWRCNKPSLASTLLCMYLYRQGHAYVLFDELPVRLCIRAVLTATLLIFVLFCRFLSFWRFCLVFVFYGVVGTCRCSSDFFLSTRPRIIYSSKSMDQPDKVASPARGQLNRKNEYFPVRVRA